MLSDRFNIVTKTLKFESPSFTAFDQKQKLNFALIWILMGNKDKFLFYLNTCVDHQVIIISMNQLQTGYATD